MLPLWCMRLPALAARAPRTARLPALRYCRGLSILLLNPLFRLLGSEPLSPQAVLFATWGGLRCGAAGP